ncbi:hypothetical protein Q4567_21910 [Aliiglaciecola sp. 2_MG-2023]|uniref:hypothetical protein n=1 Tax=unclassified Aliiglaciecola TaxID=2593648 RepID=UPI0026E4016A|nr:MULTISPECIES: hypothetical protein [unclassified Aliiglaciecola]MDO6713395.1 hypothetical protein [Aliiglaciecola sp. 2_MG-2023]MDO6754529.1 hypothetical protein [Aliiglaciecola sp. 1_MG-2023]
MSVFKKLKYAKSICLLTYILMSVGTPLSAHVLNETTAQVVLRDGQVEVKVHTDIEHLISALKSDQAWLLGDIDTLMPENLNASQQQAFIANALKQKMNLIVNGELIVFETATFDNNSELDKSRVHDREIVFQARHSFAQVSELSISFHKSLGAVHTSVVKPQYKLLGAGETAHIVF